MEIILGEIVKQAVAKGIGATLVSSAAVTAVPAVKKIVKKVKKK